MHFEESADLENDENYTVKIVSLLASGGMESRIRDGTVMYNKYIDFISLSMPLPRCGDDGYLISFSFLSSRVSVRGTIMRVRVHMPSGIIGLKRADAHLSIVLSNRSSSKSLHRIIVFVSRKQGGSEVEEFIDIRMIDSSENNTTLASEKLTSRA